MDVSEATSALMQSALATELSQDQVRTLAGIAVCRTLADGESLIEEGTSDGSLYAVCEGKLKICRPGPHGDPVTLHTVGVGNMVGEIGFLDGLTRTATVQASGPATVIGLNREALEGLIDQDPWLVYRVMRAVIRSIYKVVTNLNRDNQDLVEYVMR